VRSIRKFYKFPVDPYYEPLSWFITYQRLSHEAHELMNQTEKIAYGGSCKQDGAPRFGLKKLNIQRTCVSKSKAVKLTQPKI